MSSDLNELYLMLGRIESKVDGLSKHEERITVLEKQGAWTKGVTYTIGILWGVALALLGFLR